MIEASAQISNTIQATAEINAGGQECEDITVNVYLDGVLQDTEVVPCGEDADFNITLL